MKGTVEQVKRVGILGAGYIADYHLFALQRAPGVAVVGVCDLSRTRAERLASQMEGAQAYTDLARMIAEARPDVVHVLTPPTAHFAPTRQLLEAGVSVFAEKPLAVRSEDCAALGKLAAERGLALGTGHNFLFAPAYERLMQDVASGRLGRLDQVDIVWNKPLPQVQFGPFGGWLFKDSRNILLEVGPHSFAHLAHLLGGEVQMQAEARDPVRLPNDLVFHRHWEIQGQQGRVGARLRFSFIDGYPEHYVHVRGSAASATVDFELSTYTLREHSQDLLDFDRFAASVRGARDAIVQAGTTLGSFVLSKAGLPFDGGPYQTSISKAVRTFYEGLAAGAPMDRRLGAELAGQALKLAEATTRAAKLSDPPPPRKEKPANGAVANGAHATNGGGKTNGHGKRPPSTVLVLGGTGFIGRALVRRLRSEGLGVRALVRDTGGHAEALAELGAELVKGDFNDTPSIEAAMDGIQHVYHLARGYGRTWDDYIRLDVEPTRRLAELCLPRGVALYYTSSIAIYAAGKPGDVITEDTPPGKGTIRVNPYARVKVEIEKLLLELYRDRGLKLVIFRPGIVIGAGGSPYHWGVGAWPYNSICRVWGEGNDALPFVLVEDCADAMVRVVGRQDVWGESFNLVGEPCLTGNQYLDELERIAGIKVRRLPVPAWRRFVEDIAKYGLKTIAGSERNLPSYAYYVGLSNRARYSPEKTKQRLGWRPRGELAQVVDQGIAAPVAEFLV
jgi:predicted dehydrogenase/nucleoside-diphosphate-sugar epimerase